MKKTLIGISVLAFLFPFLALARGNHHRTPPPPPPVVASTTPVAGFSYGTYNNQQKTAVGTYTEYFTDGTFIGGNNSVIFMEPPMNDSSVLAGKFDATLQSFATAASKYSNVILALGEEMNCAGSHDTWSVGYDGNTLASSILTIQHESTIARKYDPTIKIAQDLNADNCNGSYPTISYFAGSSYVDIIGLDDFSDGSESWSQLFQPAINNLKGLGKPIDVLSEGASSNQSQFVSQTVIGATQDTLGLVMWFQENPYTAPTSLLKTL